MKGVSCSSEFMTNIYADNAATTIISDSSLEAIIVSYRNHYGNPSSKHGCSKEPKNDLRIGRTLISECIHSKPEEIFFTSGGTESDNWAIRGCISEKKNHIITTKIEHPAIIETCHYLEKLRASVSYLPVDPFGHVSEDELSSEIGKDTALVSIMHVNNEIGTIQNIGELSKISHNKGALFHTDAVQSVGHIPIDVNEMGVDLLSASAHKFNGPRGVGFLYVRNGTFLNPLLYGGHQQNNMRAGTENVPGIMGMAVALKENVEQIEKSMKHISGLESLLI